MVRADPYTPDRGDYECTDCGARTTGDRRPPTCPDCGGPLRNVAVARE